VFDRASEDARMCESAIWSRNRSAWWIILLLNRDRDNPQQIEKNTKRNRLDGITQKWSGQMNPRGKVRARITKRARMEAKTDESSQLYGKRNDKHHGWKGTKIRGELVRYHRRILFGCGWLINNRKPVCFHINYGINQSLVCSSRCHQALKNHFQIIHYSWIQSKITIPSIILLIRVRCTEFTGKMAFIFNNRFAMDIREHFALCQNTFRPKNCEGIPEIWGNLLSSLAESHGQDRSNLDDKTSVMTCAVWLSVVLIRGWLQPARIYQTEMVRASQVQSYPIEDWRKRNDFMRNHRIIGFGRIGTVREVCHSRIWSSRNNDLSNSRADTVSKHSNPSLV
jgi:hypothetical protein